MFISLGIYMLVSFLVFVSLARRVFVFGGLYFPLGIVGAVVVADVVCLVLVLSFCF